MKRGANKWPGKYRDSRVIRIYRKPIRIRIDIFFIHKLKCITVVKRKDYAIRDQLTLKRKTRDWENTHSHIIKFIRSPAIKRRVSGRLGEQSSIELKWICCNFWELILCSTAHCYTFQPSKPWGWIRTHRKPGSGPSVTRVVDPGLYGQIGSGIIVPDPDPGPALF